MNALFYFHSAQNAMVFPGPDGKPMAITTKVLRELGWKAEDADMRKALPRFDVPRVQLASR
jgi:hypothetical protein